MKTAKFGGTSLADAARFRQVKRIVSADPELRFVVVSAPGKRSAEDKKVTDLLYDCHAAVKTGTDPETAFAPVAVRFRQIAQELRLGIDLEAELRQIEKDLRSGASAAYCASRGEYLSGRMLAALLGWPFLDPAELHFFDADGVPQHKLAEQALMHRLHDMERAVMPGFYGGGADGRIHTLPRGGSDISGALLASASGSDAYENWTDVSGILMADPRIVPDPLPIERITYNELRELSFVGAQVLHEGTVFPVREKNIPLNIRNTNDPDHPGTLIMESFDDVDDGRLITGIAGKKNYSIITIAKSGMSSSVGTFRQVFEVFERHGVSIEYAPSGIDCLSLVVSSEKVAPCLYSILGELEKQLHPDNLHVTENISIVAAVGRKMAFRPGTSGRIFAALGEHGINIRMISQGPDELNIIVGVDTKDFAPAIQVLYNSFVK